eukprot:jgi/Tetstr1/464464/TSEL_009222.t1
MELQAAVGKLGAALAGRPLLARCGQWSAARTGARRVHCCACSDDLRQVSFQYPEDINEVCIYRLTATDGYFLVAASTGRHCWVSPLGQGGCAKRGGEALAEGRSKAARVGLPPADGVGAAADGDRQSAVPRAGSPFEEAQPMQVGADVEQGGEVLVSVESALPIDEGLPLLPGCLLALAGWERFLCGGRGANDGSIAGRSQHAEGEGDACGGLRCAAAHPAAITCALVVQDAGRGGHGAGAHTSFDGPLFRAVLGVACDGIPPQYVLVGDAAGCLWAYGSPGTPFACPGVMAVDLQEPILSLLPSRLGAPGSTAGSADTLLVSGASGRLVAMSRAEAAGGWGAGRGGEDGEGEGTEGGEGGGAVCLRDWQLPHGNVTSVAVAGSRLVYAAGGKLYCADLISPAADGARLVERLCAHEVPYGKAVQLIACDGHTTGVTSLTGAGELATWAPSPVPLAALPPAHTRLPAAEREVEELMTRIENVSAACEPLQDHIRHCDAQLADLAPSIAILSELRTGGGLKIDVDAGRLLDHMPDPKWRRGVDIAARVTNSSPHTLPPIWNLLLWCPTSGVGGGGESESESVCLRLPRLAPGQQWSSPVALPIVWRGALLLRAFLWLSPPTHLQPQAIGAAPPSGQPAAPGCVAHVGEYVLDAIDFWRAAGHGGTTPSGGRVMGGQASGGQRESLALRVLSAASAQGVLERIRSRGGASVSVAGQAGDRMEGQASAHGHSAPVTLQCKPVGGTSGAGGGGPADDGGAPRELEITTTSASMPVLIQAHNAVLRRARELSTAAARSPGGAPQQASASAASRESSCTEQQVAEDLQAVKAVKVQITALQDALNGVLKLHELVERNPDEFASVAPLIKSRTEQLRAGIWETFVKLRQSYSLPAHL